MSGFLSENVTKNSHKSAEWYTPAWVFELLGLTFDLDPSSPHDMETVVPAETKYTIFDHGLKKEWFGRVWMNPPFGHQSTKRAWLEKFFLHGNCIALLPDRTSAPWWQEFAGCPDLICFVSPKVKFERPDGTYGEQPGTGTCLFAAGEAATKALLQSGLGVCLSIVRNET